MPEEKRPQERGYLWVIALEDRSPESSLKHGTDSGSLCKRTVLCDGGCSYPIGIVVDLDVGILVHGGEGHAMLQLVGQDPPVHHVVAKGIEQFDVDIAHQGVQHFLEGRTV